MEQNNNRTNAKNINTTAAYNLEEMIAYIRQNPNIALGIHHHLTEAPHLQQLHTPIEASTPQTPKRNLDSKYGQMNVSTAPKASLPLNNNIVLDQHQPQISEHQQGRLPFEQLKRAVSSNLPCFLIEYDQDVYSKNRPSDISAASFLEDHFKQQGISITFSLVGHSGIKLKLGVSNKEMYVALISTDKWPSQINNINITVIKPKFIPDAFALVVRYVPLQYNEEYVKEEIERNLQSVENVRRIQYHFQRRTNDIRFVVKDLREYNSKIKLGRISIGNTLCTITPFLTGNRMTFCTRCWCLGHMRNRARCAQCNGDHQSLSSEWDKVVEYRSELKVQVNNAISLGKLHRLIPQDRTQSIEFQTKQNEFPLLPQCMSGAAPWKLASAQQATTTNMNGSEDVTKMFVLMNQNILDMKENTHRIDEKLDRINEKVNQTALDTELHQETLMKLLPICVSIVCDFIWPVMAHNVAGLGDKHSQLQKLLSNVDLLLRDLKSDYSARRKRSTSPPPQLSPSQQPSKSPNITTSNELDQNMSK
ncbi:unnamed protein product [Rotaria magnacalcarata]|uniref:Uncharacterized protein n=2 Tax=Rotaria magnacalcarata TaxID=392030 RepID=A0A816U874_9BILA|nr:unnamed protein product [Rotaria magnacalcarata]